MHDSSFEKEVQQKMEELAFSPSETVWENVDRAVNGKQKRRFPLFWLFFWPGLVAAAVAGIFLSVDRTAAPAVHTGSSKNAPATGLSAVPPATAATQPASSTQPAAPGGSAAYTPSVQPVAPTGSAASVQPAASLSTTTERPAPASSQTTANPRIATGPATAKANAVPVDPIATIRHSSAGHSHGTAGGGITTDATGAGINGMRSAATINNRPGSAGIDGKMMVHSADATPSALKSAVTASRAAIPTSKHPLFIANLNSGKKAAAVQKIQLAPRPTWTAGFMGGIGASSQNESLFSSTTLKPGLSFLVGILVQRPLAKRLSLSLGLDLHYYSTRIKTGEKTPVNAAASFSPNTFFYSPAAITAAATRAAAYYPTGDYQNFTNQYYFLELPVSLQWQLNHSRTLPLFWEAGLTASYLVSSNALYYNTNTSAYYKDGGVTNKFQLAWSTALLAGFPVWGGKLQAGPQIQYDLSHLLNTQITGAQHLLYGGIKLVFLPGKGKK